MKKLSLFSLMLVLFIPCYTFADENTDLENSKSPSCSAPSLPQNPRNHEQAQEFMELSNQYQTCLKNYIDQQKTLAEKYKQQSIDALKAANTAVEQWNSFVKLLETK